MKKLILFIVLLLFVKIILAQGPQWVLMNTSNSTIPTDAVYQIAVDNNNDKWFTSGIGLLKYDTLWYIDSTLACGLWFSVFDYDLWIVQGNPWICNYNIQTQFDTCLHVSLPNSSVIYGTRAFAKGINNELWTGSYLTGLGKFDGTSWERNDTVGHPVSLLFKNNILWMATRDKGLYIYDGVNFFNYDTTNSTLPTNCLTTMVLDSNHNFWFGTGSNNVFPAFTLAGPSVFGKGLVKYNGSTFITFDPSNSGLPDTVVTCLAVDQQNNLWVGTKDKGLVKFDGTTWTVFDTLNSALPSNYISWIAIDHDNNKWISFAQEVIDVNAHPCIGGYGVAIYNETGVVSVENVLNKSTCNVFPNPANDQLSVEYKTQSNKAVYMIFDLYGRMVSGGSLKPNNTNIAVGNLSEGLYLLRITDGDRLLTRKFLKG